MCHLGETGAPESNVALDHACPSVSPSATTPPSHVDVTVRGSSKSLPAISATRSAPCESRPGFAAAVIVTLGLGIGANAAMFGVVDRLMFRPVRVPARSVDGQPRLPPLDVPRHDDHELVHGVHALPRPEAVDDVVRRMGGVRESRHWPSASATRRASGRSRRSARRFFKFFDAQAGAWPVLRCRPRTPRHAAPTSPCSATGSGSPSSAAENVLGEALQVGNIAATIIGVAPEGFAGVDDSNPPAVYIPITTYAASQPASGRNPTLLHDVQLGLDGDRWRAGSPA